MYMNLVTSEFHQTVEGLISNLTEENYIDVEEYRLARKHNALPIGIDLWIYIFLTPYGEAILDDGESDNPEILRTTQAIIRVVAGAKRYPQLEKFIPNRPNGSKVCPACDGTKNFGQDVSSRKPVRCVVCGGLGWVIDEA